MPEVLVLTLIFAIAIAAVSYALVESPCREALRRWESREGKARADAGQRRQPAPRGRNRAMTSARTAERRALPASSRSGVSTNSTVAGTL